MNSLDRLNIILQKQIDDVMIWSMAHSGKEDYLQGALRLMHAAIEEYIFLKDDKINCLMLDKFFKDNL